MMKTSNRTMLDQHELRKTSRSPFKQVAFLLSVLLATAGFFYYIFLIVQPYFQTEPARPEGLIETAMPKSSNKLQHVALDSIDNHSLVGNPKVFIKLAEEPEFIIDG